MLFRRVRVADVLLRPVERVFAADLVALFAPERRADVVPFRADFFPTDEPLPDALRALDFVRGRVLDFVRGPVVDRDLDPPLELVLDLVLDFVRGPVLAERPLEPEDVFAAPRLPLRVEPAPAPRADAEPPPRVLPPRAPDDFRAEPPPAPRPRVDPVALRRRRVVFLVAIALPRESVRLSREQDSRTSGRGGLEKRAGSLNSRLETPSPLP